ncbi:PREDICTED: protein KRI1 homolog [Dufourea novaeangliae]|uniref:Protein KRI1 homolog n=1 Tax=Dufourea novaeangliae TaxID=178035 RepID=A0A154PNN5_DUFNO|nr:PREDICTED: protein KRI1 homolog [Dufourea novaeangliae]KZC13463.1 Protein KRI1 like protein [Dufourea novaeangliae]
MSVLFNGDNSNSEEDLKINKDYAKNYDNWRHKEELNKLKTKYGDINGTVLSDENSDTESSSSSSEEENEVTEQFDKDFYKTLALLKKKDPKIYKQDVTFFDETNKAQELHYEKKKSSDKSKKEQAVYLRDFERNIIVEREGKFSDSEDEDKLRKIKEEAKNVTYAQEQKQIKESFKDVLHDEDENDDDVDLLKPKTKSQSEKEKEEADYKEWLKGQDSNINEQEQNALKPLRDFWSNPNLDANEQFLRDYVLNNKYLDNEYAGPELDNTHLIHDSDENLSEDEKNIEKQEEFEQKYNFRFEEPDQEFIKRYPRTMENTIRKKDTRRSQKRVEVKKRKEEEKLRKREELKQLKALKRKEIEEKIEKLKEITGNDDIKFNDIDLEGDFDPDEYDKKMTELFNDDYYAAPEDDIKPEFPEIDKDLEVETTWDNYDPNAENYDAHDGEDYEGPDCEDPNFNMDADYDSSKCNQLEEEGTKKRKRRRKSKFAELMAKQKPKFDPQQYKSYEEYFDKYYSLDYEDMIGDIPCKFKYRKVVPNDYGLSVEEILMADDKELNKWCSLKKALQYKPEYAELNDVRMYKQKANNEALKKKVLTSLYRSPEDEEKEVKNLNAIDFINSNDEETETKKKRRRKKKNKKKQEVQNVPSATETSQEKSNNMDNDEIENKGTNNAQMTSKEVKKKKKIEKRKQVEEQPEEPRELSKKKQKVDKVEESNSTVIAENKSHEEQGTNKSLKKKKKKMTVDGQNNSELSSKQSKKMLNLKDKMKKKKLNKMKRKDSKQADTIGDIASLNPERLKTYGINPKKFKNKLKYGKKQQ